MVESSQTSTSTAATPPTWKRRNPYTSVACENCKRRKAKCTGETPCLFCRSKCLECIYLPGSRRRYRPPRQHRSLSARDSRVQDNSQQSTAAFNDCVGYQSNVSTNDDAAEAFSIATDLLDMSSTPTASETETDELADLGCETLLQMLTTYEEEVGISYPIVDLEPLRHYTKSRYNHKDPDTHGRTFKSDIPAAGADHHKEHLTAIVAIVMVLQSGGQSDIGSRWIDEISISLRWRTRSENSDLHDVVLLVLLSFFYFHSDREVLAWRTAGEAARMLMELGFHRSETIKRRCPTSVALLRAVDLFWSVYITERRFSFGSGLPFVLQDRDIDDDLPQPGGTDLPSMYLKSMIAYTRIASDVWYSLRASLESAGGAADEIRDRLDFRILEWRKNLPADLQFWGLAETFNPVKHNRGHWRLRLMLYLRANQMRIMIHRNVIHRNAMPNTQKHVINLSSVNTLVEVAQDTIRVLEQLLQNSDLYEIQQKTYNFFLESALVSLIIVFISDRSLSGHACGQEIVRAMDVVRELAIHSAISHHLWNKLQVVRGIQQSNLWSSSGAPWHPISEAQTHDGNVNEPSTSNVVYKTPASRSSDQKELHYTSAASRTNLPSSKESRTLGSDQFSLDQVVPSHRADSPRVHEKSPWSQSDGSDHDLLDYILDPINPINGEQQIDDFGCYRDLFDMACSYY